MSSSIIALLKNKILTSENYGTLKSNLNMILVIDDLCFVLMEEHPSLARNASLTVRDTYNPHYILANMSDVLSKKHESMVTAHKIMDSFQEIFRQPSIQLHHEAIKYIYNASMKEDQPVKEHILNIMKKKRWKGKGPAAAAKGKGKAKVAAKGKLLHCNETSFFKQLKEVR
ncbi:gag/pol protein [Cucumis melo var. makuwa]|uniref:Gag/pol protein n=1 Tax=Cucumis melo var. makuwa TaxID=1194695 RepID=A0A5A7TDR3_CUCMM|nr:gag/pol protein [Cucumis melo var. makuwa]TYK02753.1 gag/pol protein [Cucumis melo var. makuwa]